MHNHLIWEAGEHGVTDHLSITEDRRTEIEKIVQAHIDAKTALYVVIRELRKECKTSEEFASFMFSLGYWEAGSGRYFSMMI